MSLKTDALISQLELANRNNTKIEAKDSVNREKTRFYNLIKVFFLLPQRHQ